MRSSIHSLFDISLPVLQQVMEYCDYRDVANMEVTTHNAHKLGQYIWKTFITNQNLFLFATESKAIDLKNRTITYTINLYELYGEKACTGFFVTTPFSNAFEPTEKDTYTEKFIANPINYTGNSNLYIKMKEYILKTNQQFLSQFSPKPEQLSLPASELPANSTSQAFLTSRHEGNPWRKLFSQFKNQNTLTIKSSKKVKSIIDRRATFLSSMQLTTNALNMLSEAQNKQHMELFSLLQNYRNAQCKESKEHIYYNIFLLLQEINRGNPHRLQTLITALKIDHLAINIQFSSTIFPKAWEFSDTASNFDGETALKRALKGVYPQELDRNNVVRILLAAKANVCEPGLLHYALKFSHVDLVHTLIANKADVNQMEGEVPLGQALCHRSVLEDLSTTQSIITALLAAKADINGRNSRNETPLMQAAQLCSDKMFQFFLLQGPDPYLADGLGKTTLMHAVSTKDSVKKVKMLLAPRGIEPLDSDLKMPEKEDGDFNHVDQIDHLGQTALTHAIIAGQPEMRKYVKLLIRAKATIKLEADKNSETPLALAKKKDYSDVVSLLSKTLRKDSEKKEKRKWREEFLTPTKKRTTPPLFKGKVLFF